jgi:hypothetical protein
LEDWKIGRLQDYKITRLQNYKIEDYKIGRLEDWNKKKSTTGVDFFYNKLSGVRLNELSHFGPTTTIFNLCVSH